MMRRPQDRQSGHGGDDERSKRDNRRSGYGERVASRFPAVGMTNESPVQCCETGTFLAASHAGPAANTLIVHGNERSTSRDCKWRSARLRRLQLSEKLAHAGVLAVFCEDAFEVLARFRGLTLQRGIARSFKTGTMAHRRHARDGKRNASRRTSSPAVSCRLPHGGPSMASASALRSSTLVTLSVSDDGGLEVPGFDG